MDMDVPCLTGRARRRCPFSATRASESESWRFCKSVGSVGATIYLGCRAAVRGDGHGGESCDQLSRGGDLGLAARRGAVRCDRLGGGGGGFVCLGFSGGGHLSGLPRSGARRWPRWGKLRPAFQGRRSRSSRAAWRGQMRSSRRWGRQQCCLGCGMCVW